MHPRPKKRLGQHFLHDRQVRRKIVDACGLSEEDCVLEIGAGRGEMTALLAGRVRRLWAVELDRSLCPALREAVSGFSNVEVVNSDILKVDLARYAAEAGGKISVIGNLPYYLSTPIITYLITFRKHIRLIQVMLQKEYAGRLAASSGSKLFGSLSCYVQYYLEPELLFLISHGAFTPAPKVDSALVRLSVRPRTLLFPESREEKLFFRIVRAAFSQKRKTLRNSLKGVVKAEVLIEFLDGHGLDVRLRPERLGVAEFAELAKKATEIKD